MKKGFSKNTIIAILSVVLVLVIVGGTIAIVKLKTGKEAAQAANDNITTEAAFTTTEKTDVTSTSENKTDLTTTTLNETTKSTALGNKTNTNNNSSDNRVENNVVKKKGFYAPTQYRSSGPPVKIVWDSKGDSVRLVHEASGYDEYILNELGEIVSFRSYYNGSYHENNTEYEYNEKHLITKMKDERFTTLFEYDRNDNVSLAYYEGNKDYGCNFYYDENGNIIKIVLKDFNKNIIGEKSLEVCGSYDRIVDFKYTFNSNGYPDKEWVYLDGNLDTEEHSITYSKVSEAQYKFYMNYLRTVSYRSDYSTV